MYSLYLFSSFVQGSLLLSAAHVVSHACTLACTLPACHMPHCSHPDPLLRPHPRPNSKHNQNQPKKHFLGTATSLPPPADCAAGREGCVLTSQPRAFPRVLHSRAITF